MALTPQQKSRLIAAYEPILYFHPEEAFVPVDPATYMENAALWCTRPADPGSRHDKRNWGGCRPGGEGEFPRSPLIPKGGISVDPAQDTGGTADPDGDGVNEWYLGQDSDRSASLPPPFLRSNDERMLWLEVSGWEDSEEVGPRTLNAMCGVERAVERWRGDPLRAGSDRYYADVEDLESLADVFAGLEQQGIHLGPAVAENFGRAWFVLYHFLFPVYRAGDYDRWSYEGNWTALGVIIPEPEPLRQLTDPVEISQALDRLLDHAEERGEFFPPALLAFGRSARGVPDAQPALQQMNMFPSGEVSFFGSHPRVFVARGTHNLYPVTGSQEPPAFADPSCEPSIILPEGYDEEFDERVHMGLVGMATSTLFPKMISGAGIGIAAGGGIGSGVGALIGFAVGCFLAEGEVLAAALGYPAAHDTDVEVVIIPSPSQDFPPENGHYGLVLVPEGGVVGFPDAAGAAEVRPWAGTAQDKLLLRSEQIWWPSVPDHPGYDGLWGAMCQNDPCNSRSGMPMPPFRSILIEELAIHLSR